jgi:hypothetical protein
MWTRSKTVAGLIAGLLCSTSLHADGLSNGAAAGVASGDLSGSYPNPTVAKINGSAPAAVATSGSASDLSAGTLNSARLPGGLSVVLGSLRAANFNSTADQAIAIPARITAFQITKITVTNCTGTFTLAAGGFYPTTSKGGTAIVAAGQAYSALSATTIVLNPALASNPRMALANVYLSLTTAAGSAATCDVYVMGDDLT